MFLACEQSRLTMFGFGLDIVSEFTVRDGARFLSDVTGSWADPHHFLLLFPHVSRIHEFQVNRSVSDLMISMFYVAAQNTTRITLCFPMEVRTHIIHTHIHTGPCGSSQAAHQPPCTRHLRTFIPLHCTGGVP